MSSSSSTSSTKRSNDESSYDSDIQLLEGMPTKIRRLTFENDSLRQERAKDKLQLAAKDSVIAILVASLKKPDGDVAAPAAAPVPIVAPAAPIVTVVAPAPVAPAVVKPATVNVATSPVLVPAPAKQRTTTPVVAAAAPKPVAAPVVAAAPKKPVPAPVAAPVVVAKKAAPVAAPVVAAPVPKQLKLQHPAVAVPDDECSEYGEEEEEEASPAPAAQMTEEEVAPEEEDEDEDEDLQVVSVKYHSAKEPKDFFYVASTQNLYRINYDEDGEQEVGDLVATYDLAAKKITQRFAAL